MLAQKMFVKKFKSEQEFKETEMLHKNATGKNTVISFDELDWQRVTTIFISE